MTSITDINTQTTKKDLKRIEARIDDYIDMGHFGDPHKARPYLIDGALRGYEMAKAEARLTNTIIAQLQRAHKASDEIKDQQITELTSKLEVAKKALKKAIEFSEYAEWAVDESKEIQQLDLDARAALKELEK